MKYYLLLILASSTTLAMEPLDNYYSSELDSAVNQAREYPHHYDYSNYYRYKRTTAQSIELNRIGNDELDNTIVDIPEDSVQADEAPEKQLSHQSNDYSPTNAFEQKGMSYQAPVATPTGTATYRNGQSVLSNSGIVDNSTIISRPRQ